MIKNQSQAPTIPTQKQQIVLMMATVESIQNTIIQKPNTNQLIIYTPIAQIQVIKEISKMKYLTSLQISLEPQIMNEAIYQIKQMKNLKKLLLPDSTMQQQHCEMISEMTWLEQLDLSFDDTYDAFSSAVLKSMCQKLTNLKSLLMGCNGITVSGAQVIATNLLKLQTLWLDSNPIKDKGALLLCRLINLKDLNINDTQITSTGLKQIPNLINLIKLNICNNQIDDIGFMYISYLKNLKQLKAVNTKITNSGCFYLSKLKNLQLIYVSQNREQSLSSGKNKLSRMLKKAAEFRHQKNNKLKRNVEIIRQK